MSLKIPSPSKSERQELALLRRQSVFMFIATHLDADGCFEESMSYIAATVAGSNRHSVQYAVESLIETGDIIVVESERRDTKGKPLPNRQRPVPVRTFWVREWVRNGSKTGVSTGGMSAHGERGVECSRSKSLNSQDLTSNRELPVLTDKTRASAHKNSTLYREQLNSISAELQSTACSTHRSAHGFTKYIDPPVQRALDALQDKLKEMKAQQQVSPHNPYWAKEVAETEAEIAELGGVQ
jgi:hypothetical protein